eukprot:1176017-Prorocentrum_minimum.AAC.1
MGSGVDVVYGLVWSSLAPRVWSSLAPRGSAKVPLGCNPLKAGRPLDGVALDQTAERARRPRQLVPGAVVARVAQRQVETQPGPGISVNDHQSERARWENPRQRPPISGDITPVNEHQSERAHWDTIFVNFAGSPLNFCGGRGPIPQQGAEHPPSPPVVPLQHGKAPEEELDPHPPP